MDIIMIHNDSFVRRHFTCALFAHRDVQMLFMRDSEASLPLEWARLGFGKSVLDLEA